MNTFKKVTTFGAALGVLVLLQSCATIFGGKHNTLVFVNEQNIEAEVFVDDTLIGEASGKLFIPKRVIQHGSTLEIRAEGYRSEEYLILLKPHAGYILADFAVATIPLIIDFATGDILRPKPRKFDVSLEKAE